MSRPERAAFRREVQAIFQDLFSIFNPFYQVDHLLEMPLHLRDREATARKNGR